MGPRPASRWRFAIASAVAATALLAAPAAQGAVGSFSNTGHIAIPEPGEINGQALPFPSPIAVDGLGGAITDVDVTLHNVGHTDADDLDIVLVSPGGDAAPLMSDACGPLDVEDVDWTFDDQASSQMPDVTAGEAGCVSSSYQPTVYDASTDFWPVAVPPQDPTGGRPFLGAFNGENANGEWRLYIRDDGLGIHEGDVEAGWSLEIETGPFEALIPAAGTMGEADPYPLTLEVSGNEGITTDVNLVLDGLFHTFPIDLDMLLVGPHGEKAVVMSDACGAFDVANRRWRWDDEAPAIMPDVGIDDVCNSENHRPTDHGGPDLWLPPAPAGPYPSTLSVFDSIEPNGVWSLYINDDQAGDSGFLAGEMLLEVTTRQKAKVAFAGEAAQLAEGSTHQLTLTRSDAPLFLKGSVRVRSAAGTASEGADFTPVDQEVTFAAGETTASVPVTIPDEGVHEPSEQFTLVLTPGSGDALPGPPSTIAITIPGTSPPQSETPQTTPPLTVPALSPPETRIDGAPPRKTRKRRATFRFSSVPAGATFRCQLDQGPAAPCASPHVLRKLKRGPHTFQVTAVDATGQADATPATHRWRVKKPRAKKRR